MLSFDLAATAGGALAVLLDVFLYILNFVESSNRREIINLLIVVILLDAGGWIYKNNKNNRNSSDKNVVRPWGYWVRIPCFVWTFFVCVFLGVMPKTLYNIKELNISEYFVEDGKWWCLFMEFVGELKKRLDGRAITHRCNLVLLL